MHDTEEDTVDATCTLTGHAAIDHAEEHNLLLCKYADPEEGACDDLTRAEAREVAAEDAGLIWMEDPLLPELIVTCAVECAQGNAKAVGLPAEPHDPYDGDFENGLHELTGPEPTPETVRTFEIAYRAEQDRLIDEAIDGDETYEWAPGVLDGWKPTHRITTLDEPDGFDVMLDDGPAYTLAEFVRETAAAYECWDDGEWTFQGQAFEGTVEALA